MKPRPGPRCQPTAPIEPRLGAQPVERSLRDSSVLAQLLARAAEAQRRLTALLPLLDGTMRDDVSPGGLDGEGFTLLAANQAAAAKLRQLLPTLQAQLQRDGFDERPLRIRVQASRGR